MCFLFVCFLSPPPPLRVATTEKLGRASQATVTDSLHQATVTDSLHQATVTDSLHQATVTDSLQ